MKITLVTCFNANWHYGRVPAPYIPLNLLGLGAALRNGGHTVEVVDQTLALMQGKANDGPDFHDEMAEVLLATQPDVIGFTSMCNSYPQTLSLARHYRARAADAKIILGGPQATVVDTHTLEAFPWIDAVVRGEADRSLLELVDRWANDASPEGVAGVTWRGTDGQVHRNDSSELLLDLNELPFPAYDLYPFDQVRVKLVPVEAGRGCPYGCTFCSTNVFFNRRYRIKSAERLIEEMKFLNERYGFDGFDLVHDMFTVDRRWVNDFCQAMIASGHKFRWGCSARVDRVDEPLLKEMAEAGCIGIFFGIETGSQRLQPIIKKNLKMETVLPIIRACIDNNLGPTASCITGYPAETEEDSLDSLNLALDVIHLSPKTRAQMHMLAPLVGSPLYNTHQDELKFDGHSSDISLFLLTAEEIAVVRQHPKIFPNFYYIPTPHLDRDWVKAVSAVTYTCSSLFTALRHAEADLKTVLRGWLDWKRRNLQDSEIGQDYYYYHFGLDMCRYLREEVLEDLIASAPYLEALVGYFEIRYGLQRLSAARPTTFHPFDYDVLTLNTLLRTDAPWPEKIEPQPSDLLFINLATTPDRGFAYLEVNVPRKPDPLIRMGDQVEVRDPIKQLQTRPHLIIRNNTLQKVFATKHHMTEQNLRALGVAV